MAVRKKPPDRSADAIDKEIGARIREYRLRLGISQAALAEEVGVTFQQIQKYEKATNRVSAGRLYNISQAIGVSIAEMYAGQGKVEPGLKAKGK